MTNERRSICPFCSMGCTLRLRPGTGAAYVGEEGIPALDYDADGPHNRGSLCAKGNMSLEVLTHPKRFESPRIRRDGKEHVVSWAGAMLAIENRIRRIVAADGPEAVGVLVGPQLTNEETRAAVALARSLGTPHCDVCLPEDRGTLLGLARSPATPDAISSVDEIDAMTALLVVGDPFSLSPCIAKPVLNSRYDRRQNVLGVLGAAPSHTQWFGKPHLACRPGQETAALALMLHVALDTEGRKDVPYAALARSALETVGVPALEDLSGLNARAVGAFLQTLITEERTGILLAPAYGATERWDLATGLATLLAEVTGSRTLCLFEGPNAQGTHAAMSGEGYPARGGYTAPEMMEAAVTGDLKALIVLGGNPVGAYPGDRAAAAARRLEYLVASSTLPNETTEVADVVLPACAWGEKEGSVTPSFGADMSLEACLPAPGAARPDGAFLEEMRRRFAASGPAAEPPTPRPVEAPDADAFFGELELFFRMERRELGRRSVGSHVLLPECLPAHAACGGVTRHLSWPKHEMPGPEVVVSPAHAASLSVEAGDTVRVRSSGGEVPCTLRIEEHVPEDVVLAPPHFPEVRRLLRWRIDPVLRDLDLRPVRVSVVREGGNGR